jgi:hypothetical protein
MGHGAWGMGHGAWSMEHGAWSMEKIIQGKLKNARENSFLWPNFLLDLFPQIS